MKMIGHQAICANINHQGQSLPITAFWLRSFGDKLVDIGAYCLMPNHFHLLVREKEDNGISQFMKKLLTGYPMYINNDAYLKYLFAYIHLNPVKINDPSGWKNKTIRRPETAKEFLTNYEYSSYPYYSGRARPSDSILNPKAFPDYFAKQKEFNEFIKDWIDYSAIKVSP